MNKRRRKHNFEKIYPQVQASTTKVQRFSRGIYKASVVGTELKEEGTQ